MTCHVFPFPALPAAGLARELPLRFLPEPSLRSGGGRGILRAGCGFPYPVVSTPVATRSTGDLPGAERRDR